MTSHRGILGLVLLASVALTLIASTQADDLIVGKITPDDHLAYRESVTMPPLAEEVVTVDRTFYTAKDEKISAVRLLDQVWTGTGATATVLAGGPGFNYVTAHFESQRGQGIAFVVDLFGH